MTGESDRIHSAAAARGGVARPPRVVLIVGASSGIGAACAARLAARGERVFVASRRAAEPPGAGSAPPPATARALFMDVTSDASVDAAIAALLAETSRIDAVIHCAGYGLAGPVETTSLEEAKAQLETNLFGLWRVCRAVLPAMRRQRRGHIVVIGSLAGRIGLPFQAAYCASKFAIAGFAESLSAEVGPYGVRVALVEPGNIHTPFTDARRIARDADASGYGARFRRALETFEREERGGGSAASVAALVVRILDDPAPRLRHTTGPLLERLAALSRALVPGRLFEWAIVRRYGGVDEDRPV